MKMYVHSSYGVLDCIPMTLQAIENSIPEGQVQEQNTDTEATVGEQVSVSPETADKN